jgi:hypothetical protein
MFIGQPLSILFSIYISFRMPELVSDAGMVKNKSCCDYGQILKILSSVFLN